MQFSHSYLNTVRGIALENARFAFSTRDRYGYRDLQFGGTRKSIRTVFMVHSRGVFGHWNGQQKFWTSSNAFPTRFLGSHQIAMTGSSERNIMQIMILDQGVIQFNAKPREGIAFLVKNKVISDDPLEVAKFLATTDKLDKHVLGNFLGKDNDFSVAILNKFASLFHYEGVAFDLALRTFTNRFAMPGESQMIYRILERFSVYYAQANTEMLDKDKALILSYALIMLNVDLHSNRVKAKMTKDEFVRNTELALGSCVTRAQLEAIYMRILEKELKPDTTAEEIVYSKLAVNPKYANRGGQAASGGGLALVNGKSVSELLKNGAILLKYGREGSPHARKIFLSSDEKKLCWVDPAKLERLDKRHLATREGGNVGGAAGELVGAIDNNLDIVRSAFLKIRSRTPLMPESFKREIPLEDITGLVVGRGGTRNFRRYFSNQQKLEDLEDAAETEQRCFSIITEYRTLDLQAPPSLDIAPWLLYLHSVLSEREKRLRAQADKNKDIWSFTQRERASLVRWQEIVPAWAEHWNCGARVSAGGGYRTSQHPKEELLNHRMFLVNPSGFVLDRGQRLETAVSPQLVALWLEGIPSSVRPRIWPIAVGNALRLDDSYFALFNANGPNSNVRRSSFSLPQNSGPGEEVPVAPSTPPPRSANLLDADDSGFHHHQERFERELERELKSSSFRKFAKKALAWIDARGSREQQAFFKPPAPNSEQQTAAHVLLTKRRGGGALAFASPSSVGGDENSSILFHEEENSASESESDTENENNGATTSMTSNGWKNVYYSTRILVSAFLTQRKDIKYVRGMAVLASMVIFNVGIQDLFRAFSVYSNVLHQHYFFDFFTLRWRDMRMRFDLYSKLLRERMPYLDDHFNAIQITSDLYFNQWLLTGFTRVLPFRTACRVWDGFLLLGESYFFTAALALLNYYEHSLMTSGFSGCLEILLGHADEVLFNDKKFFDCVHAQSVSNERFAAWISAQRLAEEKTALYDLLLLM